MQSNLTLLEPFDKCVYQRDKSGLSTIPVSGTVTAGIQNVTATFTPVNGGTLTVQTLPVDVNGNFGGTVRVPGGWYSLTISAGAVSVLLNRVGAGEVFVLFGHSFLQGGQDQTHQLPSTDERVITLSDDLTTRNFKFEQLKQKVGPFHLYPDWSGQFGDKMVRRLGVPVLIYGAAYGGSNLLQNREVIQGVHPRTQLPPGTREDSSRQPFEPLEDVFNNYIPKTGVRALLVEHGYNDAGEGKDNFKMTFRFVFDYIRSHWNKPDLSIVLVQEELNPALSPISQVENSQAQQELIATYPNTWPGPDFNLPIWQTPGFHANNNHLAGGGIDEFATEWANALTDSFFLQSIPYTGTSTPDVFPAVLYNAPDTQIKPFDWAILLLAAVVLVLLFVKKSKGLMWAFLALGLIALARVTGKV